MFTGYLIYAETNGDVAFAQPREPGSPDRSANGGTRGDPVVAGPVGRSLELAQLGVDFHMFPARRSMRLAVGGAAVRVVVPISGSGNVVTPDTRRCVSPGSAVLLAGRGGLCVWAADSAGLVLRLPRALIQAQAYATFGEPRRLANIALFIDCATGTDFGAAITTLLKLMAAEDRPKGAEIAHMEKRIVAGLVGRIRAADVEEKAFPVAGSVKRAVDHLRADGCRGTPPDQLAGIAGVTLATLRRNFKDCLGVSLARFIQHEQLEWARQQLSSATETRSIAALAQASGLEGAGVFTRAYQRRFGETPSQTRASAFAVTGR